MYSGALRCDQPATIQRLVSCLQNLIIILKLKDHAINNMEVKVEHINIIESRFNTVQKKIL